MTKSHANIITGINGAARVLAGLAGMLFAVLALTGGAAAETGESTICQLCGMDAAKSQTEFVLFLDQEATPMHACCLNCARRIMKKLGSAVTRVTALDYLTHKYVDAKAAFYLKGSKLMPTGSMAPFILTFGAREDAETFNKKYGGRVLTFDDAVAEMK